MELDGSQVVFVHGGTNKQSRIFLFVFIIFLGLVSVTVKEK